MNSESEYITTSDEKLIERFAKVAPTKYLTSLVTRAHPAYDYWDGAKIPVRATWSFSKNEKYRLVIYDLDILTNELKNRPNIRHSNKPDKREITCNQCGHKMDFVGSRFRGKDMSYAVFDCGRSMPIFDRRGHRMSAKYYGLKAEFIGKKKYVCFDCPKCGEHIMVQVW